MSQRGTWEEWIDFFLSGVAEQSRDALWRAGKLMELWKEFRRVLSGGRTSTTALRALDALFEMPVTSIPATARHLGVTQAAASKIIQKLISLGMLVEVTGRKRDRLFAANDIIAAIEAPGPAEVGPG